MSVFKRSDERSRNYYFYVENPSGKPTKRSTGTRDKRLALSIQARHLLATRDRKTDGHRSDPSFKELIVIYLDAKQKKPGFARLQFACKPLLKAFGEMTVSEVDGAAVDQYIADRSQVVGDGTVNRELGTLSAAVNYVRARRGWKVDNPVTGYKLPEPPGRVRWLTRAEAARLIDAAGCPTCFSSRSREKLSLGQPLTPQYRSPYLRDFIELALQTGCRKQELLGLEWRFVNLDNDLILLEKTKNGSRRSVPLNGIARSVLTRRMEIKADVCPDTQWVFFHIKPTTGAKVGDRVKDVRTAFATACMKADIADFRIHDLRHTAASWLVTAGVPLLEVSQLLGHKSITQTQRYAHLAPESIRKVVQFLEGTGTKSSTLSSTWTTKGQWGDQSQ